MQMKKIKQLALILLACIASTKVSAQSMNLGENNLDKAKNLSIVCVPVGFDVYNQNLNLFAEARLQYRFKKELGWLSANYKIAYLDRTEENSFVETIAGSSPLKELAATVGFNFKKKEIIKIATPGFYTRRNKIRLPVKFLRSYGIHAGYSQFQSIFASGSTTNYNGEITLGADTKSVTVSATPMFSAGILHLGIHRQWLENYVIDYSTGGEKKSVSSKSIKTVYADFFYAPFMNLEPVYLALGENSPNSNQNYNSTGGNFNYNYYPVNLNAGTKKIPVGARIGMDLIELDGFGYNYGFEVGFRPGVYTPLDNLYILVKMGFSINAKLK